MRRGTITFAALFVFASCLPLAAQTTSGTIYGSETWDSSMNPIVVTGDVTIDSAATLTIGPGVEVRFQENGDDTHWGWDTLRSELSVYGTLVINGTADELVVLTSTGTAGGGWFGVVFSDNTAGGTINYFNIDHSVYGVNFTACDGPLYGGVPPAVANCFINDVSVGMLFDNTSSPSLTNCTVVSAGTAFGCYAGSAPVFTNCNVASLTDEKQALYGTEGAQPSLTGCAFSSGAVVLDMAATATMTDTSVTGVSSAIIGLESKSVGSAKILSGCSLALSNCNIIGLGDEGNGIEWDDNLAMLTVEYSRLGGFNRIVWPRWGSQDVQAGILHVIGPRFTVPYYGTCTGGDNTFLIDNAVNFYNLGAFIGMTVTNDTDGSGGTVTGIVSIPGVPVSFNTLQTSGMSGGGSNDANDIYHFTPLGAFNNMDLGDLGTPDPYRNWPPGHVPSAGQNEFYGIQDPGCLFNLEMEQSGPLPPQLYQLEVWAEGNWWVTSNGIVINRYIWDNNENIYLGGAHVSPHRAPDAKRSYSVSGRIVDTLGEPVDGVRVSVDVSAQFPGHTVLADVTDTDGVYTIYGLLPSAAAYTILPQRLRYTFTPPSITVTIPVATPGDLVGQDFIATLPAPYITSASRSDNLDGADHGLPGRTNWGLSTQTTDITITGINFRETPSVFLRGPLPGSTDVSCSNTVWTGPTRLTATVPAGMTAGNYLVRVVNPDGQSVLWGSGAFPGFTIVPPPAPVVFSIGPNPIDSSFNGSLTVTGQNFTSGCNLTIGAATWPSLTPGSGGASLLVTYAAGQLSPGTWPVSVRNPDGQSSAAGVTLTVLGAAPTPTTTPGATPTPTPLPGQFPRIEVAANAEQFAVGDPVSIAIELFPGSAFSNNLVDIYVAVTMPDGSLFFLASGNRWTGSATPLFRGMFLGTSTSAVVGLFSRTANLPTGTYTLLGVLVRPGTSPFNMGNWLSSLSSSSFVFP
jgi:hypothetical protein